MVFALATLAATTSFAQSTVEIYGRANVDVSSYAATGATAGAAFDLKSRTRVADSGSRFGIRVNEDLGGGSRAFVVCETGINIDSGSTAGQGVGSGAASATNKVAADATNTSTNNFCSREGHVGYGNNSAEIRLGRQNVYWTHGELNQTGANFTSTDVLGQFYAPAAGISLGAASRLNNTILIQGNADMLGSFAGSHVYYSVNGSENAGASIEPKSKTQGIKINYNNGPLVAMYDYAKVGASANTNDAAGVALASDLDRVSQKLGAGYKYAQDSIVSLTWFQHKTKFNQAAADAGTNLTTGLLNYSVTSFAGATANTDVTIGGSRKQSGWGLNLVHNLGDNLFAYGQYAKMGKAKDNAGTSLDDTGATGLMVGVRKNLSKRTGVYATYAQIKNDKYNGVNFAGGNYASGNAAAGSDPKVTSIGIMHNF